MPMTTGEAGRVERGFPRNGTAGEKLRFALHYAILAPSSHNTQPWVYSFGTTDVALYADRARALPLVDPDNRELIMSCRASLFCLRLALLHFGCNAVVSTFPEPSEPDLLARVSLGSPADEGNGERALFDAIPSRRTNRMPFGNRPVCRALVTSFAVAASEEGAWLDVIEKGDRRSEVADLIAEGDRIQGANREFRRELAAWVRPNRSRARGGGGLGKPEA